VRHLLVTNDFPPKTGGIQSYLWELWRRLPPGGFGVLTPSYPGDVAFDARQPFPVHRTGGRVLVPGPHLRDQIEQRAEAMDADLVLLDPMLPIGLLGPHLRRRSGPRAGARIPYVLVAHGAEVSVPGRLPGLRSLLGPTLAQASLVIAGGHWVASEVHRLPNARPCPTVLIPPGVDAERFHPSSEQERAAARRRHGLPEDADVVLALSRLVPRKGVDVVIASCSLLAASHTRLYLAVAGTGRDRSRLGRLAAAAPVPVRFLGRVADEDLPALMACADIFAAPCRTRWLGLEQEGFGIVFLEAAASGVPAVAGDSGGASEAVAHGETGLVVKRPSDPAPTAAALGYLLSDPGIRRAMGAAARRRALEHFSYDHLAARLHQALSVVPA
jgi:phosphatidylinositol alpha-1,6-mannosyltransferase